MRIYHATSKAFKSLLSTIKRRDFIKGACIGLNFTSDENAQCINQTGKKSNIRIGDNCMIRCQIIARGNGRITIGNNTYIGVRTRLGSIDQIYIGNDVIISNEVRILDNNSHPTSPDARLEMTQSGDYFGSLWSWERSAHNPVFIEDNVWIGERSIILKGVKIGKGSIIAAGSIVTHDVPEYAIVAGNPAVVVKHLNKEANEHGKK